MKRIPGFLYYVWFPQISVFKVGRTISGLNRFRATDYRKFYKIYGKYEYVHCVWIDNHMYIENYIHKFYKNSGFENIHPKREYYFAPTLYDYLFSKHIFIDFCERGKSVGK